GQRGGRLRTAGQRGVDLARRGERGVGADVQEGADGVVGGRDPVQVRAGDLLGGHAAVVDPRGEFGRGTAGQLGRCSSPRIRGVRNWSSSAAGARASACAGVSPGRTSSGRVTLTTSPATSVTVTSAVSTPVSARMWSRTASS